METIIWNQVQYTMVYYENAVTEGIIAQVDCMFMCRLFTRDENKLVIKFNMN